jgi:hypothetical protein
MTVEALATRFSYTVLRTGNVVLQGGVDVKARFNNFCEKFQLIPSKKLVMEDLIQNAHTLFDERPSPQGREEKGEKVEHGKT